MYNSKPPPKGLLGEKLRQEENVWAEIVKDSRYLDIMASIKQDSETLLKAHYTMKSPDGEDLEALKRCKDCHKRVTRNVLSETNQSYSFSETKELRDSLQVKDKNGTLTETAVEIKEPRPICLFHPGKIMRQKFTCCQKQKFPKTKGCISREYHIPETVVPDDFAKLRAFYETPTADDLELLRLKLTGKVADQKQEPEIGFPDFRNAVVLDCEMGIGITRECEVIRLTAIDYFTREVLIDSLIFPDVKILNYNTQYSGVSQRDLLRAKECNDCIWGRDGAREMLWKFVGRQILLILHGGQNDMDCLRWIHPQVIDTQILERNGNTPVEGGQSLKNLASKLTGKVIQKPGGPHCSLEDCLATREICDWYIRQVMKD